MKIKKSDMDWIDTKKDTSIIKSVMTAYRLF